MTIPVFGEKKKAQQYVKRNAVYAIIFDKPKEKIAIISIKEAAYFLPGGGIEEGENHAMCLQREALEEMGMAIEPIHYLGYAHQYFYSHSDAEYYLNEGHFYICEKKRMVGEPLEKGHSLIWIKPTLAIEKVVHQQHAWGIK
ncbi:NUDIX domain-containing protein [Metasolibacillus meyeri]|uniref:NUDIX domain-containing protein n=1 Tax=Metasolibacillus meyeri TaxID=1071052 RepID=UPI001EE6C6EC|nr:NUDIX domain-containing protein [Metasolibacillus meyeri]